MYVSLALGTDVADMTAGYRAFRREVLESINFDELSRKGYIFQVQIADKADQEGFDVREVPITFTDRTLGESKLDASFAKDSLIEVSKWGFERRSTQVRNLTHEFGRLAKYQLSELGANKIPRKLSRMATTTKDMAEEGTKLLKYEVGRLVNNRH